MKYFDEALFATLALALGVNAEAALVINASQSANDLVAEVLAPAGGITFSNAVVSDRGGGGQSGVFSGGLGAGLGFDTGIVLSSGLVSSLPLPAGGFQFGANDALDASASGDAMLGPSAYDASVLRFDFVPAGDRVMFSYVFATTEPNAAFDLFGFFVNGVNYALAPGPEQRNSFASACLGHAAPVFGPDNSEPLTFCDAIFRNADPGGAGAFDRAINLGRFTPTLSFVAPVQSGVTNAIYLAIADYVDNGNDSAVFIAGSSFSSGGGAVQASGRQINSVSEPHSLALTTAATLAAALALRRSAARSRHWRRCQGKIDLL